MKKNYLEFIYELSCILPDLLGNSWWYSLVHEKNVTKTKSYHRIAKGLEPEKQKWMLLRALLLGVRKYFSFMFRYFKTRFRKKITTNTCCKTICFDYDCRLMGSLGGLKNSTWILLPQKRRRQKENIDEHLLLDEFLSPYDFLFIPFIALWWMTKFIHNFRHYVYVMDSYGQYHLAVRHVYAYLREETFRSFCGDVLVEGIFYERLFKRISRLFPAVSKVLYVYEGMAWEKALCNAYYGTVRIGVMCSAPCPNILNYHFDEREYALMPTPDWLGVMGEIPEKIMAESFDITRTFILGTTRYNGLKEAIEQEFNDDIRTFTTVFLSHDPEIAKAMIEWTRDKDFKDLVYRSHPDFNASNLLRLGEQIAVGSLDVLLQTTHTAIVLDSTVALEAIAYGVEDFWPIWEEVDYVRMDPIANGTEDRKEYIRNYFTFRTDEEMVELLEGI